MWCPNILKVNYTSIKTILKLYFNWINAISFGAYSAESLDSDKVFTIKEGREEKGGVKV